MATEQEIQAAITYANTGGKRAENAADAAIIETAKTRQAGERANSVADECALEVNRAKDANNAFQGAIVDKVGVLPTYPTVQPTENTTAINARDQFAKDKEKADQIKASQDKIVQLEQETNASIGMTSNGLSLHFSERKNAELKAMQIIKKAYFSFKSDSYREDVGIGVLGAGGGDKTKFWFGFGKLDGTGSGFGSIPMLDIDNLPKGTVSYYVDEPYTRYYVEIDFDAWRRVGNVVWSWSSPVCKMTNIIPNDSEIWDSLLAKNIKKQNETAFAFTEAFSPNDLQQGYYTVSSNKVVLSTTTPELYRSIKIDLSAENIKRMRVSLNPQSTAVYGVIYADRNDNYISRDIAGRDKRDIYLNYEITIPSNARYIYVSGYAEKLAELNQGVMAYKYVFDAKSNYQLSGYANNGLNWQNKKYPDPLVDVVNKAIKFIAFVPKDAYKNNVFCITSLGCYGGTAQSLSEPTSFNLWVVDATAGANQWAARYMRSDIYGYNYDYPDVIKVVGERGTLYAIVDWNVVRGNFTAWNKKWSSLIWSSSLNDKPIVQKLNANDPRIVGFNYTPPVSPTQFVDFTKLNLAVSGDSITVGNQWGYYVSQALNMKSYSNSSLGSATWQCKKQTLNGTTYSTQEYDDSNFAGISNGWQSTTDPIEIQKRVNNCAKVHVQRFISDVTAGTYPVPDIFCFAFGTNDGYYGTVEDAMAGKDLPANDSNIIFSTAGGARWAIQKIMMTYPNCRIFVLAPIQSSDVSKNEGNLTKIGILKEICRGLSVQFIDMYANCGITEKLESGTGIYLSDGLHPNTAGQKLMGAYAAAMIRNNYFATF